MALPLVYWKSRSQVNVTDEGAEGDGQFGPAILPNNDGYVVIWRDNSASADSLFSQIRFQRYDYRGLKVGAEEVTVVGGYSSTNVAGDTVAVTALPGSGFAMAWIENTFATSVEVVFKWFSGSGTELATRSYFFAHDEQPDFPSIKITARPNGDLLAVVEQDDTFVARIVPMTGAIGAANPLGGFDEGEQKSVVEVESLANGGAVALLRNSAQGFPELDDFSAFYLKFITPSGAANGQPSTIVAYNDEESDRVVEAHMAVLTNGNVVVAWSEKEDTAGATHDIYLKIYSQTGTLLHTKTNVNAPSLAGDQFLQDVVALPDGGFTLLWLSQGVNTFTFGRNFQADGDPEGAAVLVSANMRDARMAVMRDGRIAVAFEDDVAGDNNIDVFTAILDPRDGTINGNSGPNIITSKPAGATVNGLGGNDTLHGLSGGDTLNGGDGDDTIRGFAGVDILNGGAGNDTIHGGTETDFITGELGNDLLIGEAGDNLINGGGGTDSMRGGLGNDTYITDTSHDIVTEFADQGSDTISSSQSFLLPANVEKLVLTGANPITGRGNDLANTLTGNGAANILGGEGGDNTVNGGSGNDTLRGDAGNDTLNGGVGDDSMNGGEGDDVLAGGTGNDGFVGGNGNDTADFSAAAGPITVDLTVATPQDTGQGLDTFVGIESLIGSDFDDTFFGNNLVNRFDGGDGNDELRGGTSNDILSGLADNDIIVGDGGNDAIDGGDGADRLYGGTGNDIILGGAGADTIVGGPGQDRVNGAAGADRLYADGTADTFVFFDADGGDRVFSFVSGLHDIQIDASVFGGAAGAFAFAQGASPTPGGALQALLYDTDDGKLYFDADGNGAGARVHVVTLFGAPLLVAGDIVLV